VMSRGPVFKAGEIQDVDETPTLPWPTIRSLAQRPFSKMANVGLTGGEIPLSRYLNGGNGTPARCGDRLAA